jgi:fatty acid amide hydrolase 2
VLEEHIALLESSKLNAVVCPRFEEARAEADELDRRLAAGEDDPRPLLGVPCTIKESFAVAGMPNCAGLVSRAERRATQTASAAQRLLESGPILLGLTNTSELTMWIESENRVYGRTLNAYDRRRTAGGSSGGEGAAVGSGGSAIGLGTDFAGSIRLPAFYNGVFGHKPTEDLVPMTGHFPLSAGEAIRMSGVGPLARRAEDLMPMLRMLAGPDGEDARTRTVELGEPTDVPLEGLAVVLAEGASLVPVRRELREARERAGDALAAAGATVRRVRMRSLRRALELYLAAVQDGAGISLAELIAAEGGDPVTLRSTQRKGTHTRATFAVVFAERHSRWMPSRRTRRALAAGRSLVSEVEGVIGDGILLHPPAARVAPRHGRTVARPWTFTCTAIFNLLGLPATQVPMGIGRRGLPLGVQAVAARDRDHVAIAAALELERAFGGWVPPPRRSGM